MFVHLQDGSMKDARPTRPLHRVYCTFFCTCFGTFFRTIIYCLPLLFQGPLQFSAIDSMVLVLPLSFHVLRPGALHLFRNSKPRYGVIFYSRQICMVLAWLASSILAVTVLERNETPVDWTWMYGIGIPILLGLVIDILYEGSMFDAMQGLFSNDMFYGTWMRAIQNYVDALSLVIVHMIISTGLISDLDAFVPNVWTESGTGATTIFGLVKPESKEDFKSAYAEQFFYALFYALALALVGGVALIGMIATRQEVVYPNADLEESDPEVEMSETRN